MLLFIRMPLTCVIVHRLPFTTHHSSLIIHHSPGIHTNYLLNRLHVKRSIYIAIATYPVCIQLFHLALVTFLWRSTPIIVKLFKYSIAKVWTNKPHKTKLLLAQLLITLLRQLPSIFFCTWTLVGKFREIKLHKQSIRPDTEIERLTNKSVVCI